MRIFSFAVNTFAELLYDLFLECVVVLVGVGLSNVSAVLDLADIVDIIKLYIFYRIVKHPFVVGIITNGNILHSGILILPLNILHTRPILHQLILLLFFLGSHALLDEQVHLINQHNRTHHHRNHQTGILQVDRAKDVGGRIGGRHGAIVHHNEEYYELT